jgi:CrcB protein
MEFAFNRPDASGLITPGCPVASRGFLFEGSAGKKGEGSAVRILLLIVFGAAGTLSRYWLQGWIQERAGATFPAGTLAVNLAGCFLLGGVAQYSLQHLAVPPEWRIGITIGFFGAFTTFSSFGWETVRMLEDGDWARAGLYVCASLMGGLFAVLAGIRIADRI